MSILLSSDTGAGVDYEATLSDGSVFAYKQHGQNLQSSFRVLCLHGWLDNANSFVPLISRLQRYQKSQASVPASVKAVYDSDSSRPSLASCPSPASPYAVAPSSVCFISVDLDGHGKSSHHPPGAPYLHIVYALHTIEFLLKVLQWDSCHLVCHSMGAGVGLLVAAAIPSKITSFINFDSVGIWTHRPESAPSFFQKSVEFALEGPKKRRNYTTKQEAAASYMKTNAYIKQSSALLLIDRATKAVSVPLIGKDSSSSSVTKFQYAHDIRLLLPPIMIWTEDVAAAYLQRVNCPVLLFFANRKAWLQEVVAKAQKKTKEDEEKEKSKGDDGGIWSMDDATSPAISNAPKRTKMLKNCRAFMAEGDHHMHMDYPEQFTHIIFQFWEDIMRQANSKSKL